MNMISLGSKMISSSNANLFMVEFALKGTTKKEFIYRYDLVDRLGILDTENAKILNIREEDE